MVPVQLNMQKLNVMDLKKKIAPKIAPKSRKSGQNRPKTLKPVNFASVSTRIPCWTYDIYDTYIMNGGRSPQTPSVCQITAQKGKKGSP